MFNRARWRLTLWFAFAFAVIFIVLGGAIYYSAHRSLYDNINNDLEVRSSRLIQSARGGGSLFDPGRRDIQFATAGGYFYAVTGANGTLSASESAGQLNLPSISDLSARTTDGAAYFNIKTEDNEELRVYVEPVQAIGGQTVYFQVGRSIEPEIHALRRLALILAIGGVAGLWLAGVGGWWLAGQALKPIQASMDAQRKFVADASHELRTPLALIRANAEMMKRAPENATETEYVNDIIQETDRLSYLVGQMLTLARADAGKASFERSLVDVSALAEDVTRRMQLLAFERGISVDAHTNGVATVYGDEGRLGELLQILLDNAIKYTDRGGKVDITVGQQNSHVQVSVTDNGPGIPHEAIPQVFERFYRVDKSRSRAIGGTGLGLAIAKWIADAHNGRLAIKSTPEEGTTVSLELPAIPGTSHA